MSEIHRQSEFFAGRGNNHRDIEAQLRRKSRPLITLVFTFALLFLLSATATTAQTPPAAGEAAKVDAAHTLSEAQKAAIKRIKIESEKKAAPTALRLAVVVSRIYDNMLAERPDEKVRVKLSAEMKETAWELLAIKGQGVRETVNVLTPAQRRLVKSEMRKPGAPGDLSEVISQVFKLTDK